MSDNNEDDDDSSSASSDCSFFDAPKKKAVDVVPKKKVEKAATRTTTTTTTTTTRATAKVGTRGKAKTTFSEGGKKNGKRAAALTVGSSSEEEASSADEGKTNLNIGVKAAHDGNKSKSKCKNKNGVKENSNKTASDSESNSDPGSSDSDSDDAFNFTSCKFGRGNNRKGTAAAATTTKASSWSSARKKTTAQSSLSLGAAAPSSGKRRHQQTDISSSSPISPLTKKTKGSTTVNDDGDESDSESNIFNDDDDDVNEVSKKLAMFSKKQEEETQMKQRNVVNLDSDDEDDIFAATTKTAADISASSATKRANNDATTKKATNDNITATGAGKAAMTTNSRTSSAPISIHNTRQSSRRNTRQTSATTATTIQKKGANKIDPNKDSFTNSISLLESDEDDDGNDDDNIHGNNTNDPSQQYSASVNAALMRAAYAELHLKLAQNSASICKVDDDDENDDDDGGNESDIEIVPTKTPYSSAYSTSKIKPSNTARLPQMSSISSSQSQQATGPFIQLNLRTNVQSAPTSFDKKSMHGKSNMVRFRTGAKVQKLLDKYYTLYPIAKYCIVKFEFDGIAMDVNNTIAGYDMEDEELVDVLLIIPSFAESKLKNEIDAQTSSKHLHSGTKKGGSTTTSTAVTYVKINTRIKDGDPEKTHTYQLKSTDPFDKLVKAYRTQHSYSSFKHIVLKYNDIPIEGGQTPSDLGLVDGCLVEICDETEKAKQVNRMLAKSAKHMNGDASSSNAKGDVPHSSSSSGAVVVPPGGVTVKIRINGDDKSIITYGIMLNAPFQTIMTQVYEKKKVTEKDCKFEFDGQRLNPKTTPRDEDLESDETIVIEAKIDKSALEKTTKETSSTSTKDFSSSTSTAARSAPVLNARNSATMNSQPPAAINVLTLRNNVQSARTKKFRLSNDSTIQKMKQGYIKYYRKKGCSSVIFYHNNKQITDLKQTFVTLGINDMDTVIAMENGRKFMKK